MLYTTPIALVVDDGVSVRKLLDRGIPRSPTSPCSELPAT